MVRSCVRKLQTSTTTNDFVHLITYGSRPRKRAALDGLRQFALLLGRDGRDAARHDLAALGDVAAEQAACPCSRSSARQSRRTGRSCGDAGRAGATGAVELQASVTPASGRGIRGGRGRNVPRSAGRSPGGRSADRHAADDRHGRHHGHRHHRSRDHHDRHHGHRSRHDRRDHRASSRSCLRIWTLISVSCCSTRMVMKRSTSVDEAHPALHFGDRRRRRSRGSSANSGPCGSS